jgi:hypothetical protein
MQNDYEQDDNEELLSLLSPRPSSPLRRKSSSIPSHAYTHAMMGAAAKHTQGKNGKTRRRRTWLPAWLGGDKQMYTHTHSHTPSSFSSFSSFFSYLTRRSKQTIDQKEDGRHMHTSSSQWRRTFARVFMQVWRQRETRNALLFFLLSVAVMCVEAVVGILSNHLGMVGDAGHMMVDNLALFFSLFASIQAHLPSSTVERCVACVCVCVSVCVYL